MQRLGLEQLLRSEGDVAPGRASLQNPQGFSLAELVTVVAAIGILAAIAVPFMMSFVQASQTRGAAQELKSLLNHARQLAITQNRSIQIGFPAPPTGAVPATTLRFLWTTGPPLCPDGSRCWIGPGTDGNGYFRLANQAQIVFANANPVFSPLGAAAPAATFRVQNAQGTSCLDIVLSASGRIQTATSPTCP